MKNDSEKMKIFDKTAQFALPSLTLGAQVLTSLKFPEFGLIVNLLAQPFWIYSSWKAYRQAGQSGLLINSIIFTIITAGGIVNYWFL